MTLAIKHERANLELAISGIGDLVPLTVAGAERANRKWRVIVGLRMFGACSIGWSGACGQSIEAGNGQYAYRRVPQSLCTSQGRDGERETRVRDSAGIQIVENWLDIDAATPVRPIVKSVVEPDASPEASLSGRIVGAIRLDDGSVVLGDSLTASLALFDSAGQFARLIGRRGQGPGEYDRIQRIIRLGKDTIAVFDLQYARRMTRILADGTFLDSRLLPDQARSASEGNVGNLAGYIRFPVAFMNDGAMLAYVRPYFQLVPPGRGQSQYYHDSLEVQRFDVRTGQATTLAREANWVTYMYEDRRGATWAWWAPFTARASLIVSPSGYYFGGGDQFEIAEFSPSGRPLRRLRVCVGPIALDKSLAQRWVTEFVDRAAERDRQLTKEALDEVRFPEVGPAYVSLLGDRNGWLWIGEFHLSGSPQRWLVLDREGRVVSLVEIPTGVRLVDVGTDYLLGIRTDESDLQSIVVFEWDGPGSPMNKYFH